MCRVFDIIMVDEKSTCNNPILITMMYADDTVIFAEDIVDLEYSYNNDYNWKLTVTIDKTKVIKTFQT